MPDPGTSAGELATIHFWQKGLVTMPFNVLGGAALAQSGRHPGWRWCNACCKLTQRALPEGTECVDPHPIPIGKAADFRADRLSWQRKDLDAAALAGAHDGAAEKDGGDHQ